MFWLEFRVCSKKGYVTFTEPTDKVTENFTGKGLQGECSGHARMAIAEPQSLGAKRNEKDDETELNYFGARYLDPMLGMWISVDAARQFNSPYLYAGNGVNPVNVIDPDGNAVPLVVAVGIVLVRNIAIRTVTKMATVTLPSIAMKAADIASKAHLPANLKYAAAAGSASELVSHMDKRLEKGFDDVIDFLGNALSDPATTTF